MTTTELERQPRAPHAAEPHGAAAVFDPRVLQIALSEVAAFLAVVRLGGFTAAARAMHVSQPGLSVRVQRLERALGVVLVDRSVRRLTLTREGRAFLPAAERVIDDLGRAVHRVAALAP